MFCRISEIALNDPGSLPARLRALPAYTPPPGGWNALSARMAAKRRRFVAMTGGFALAASVVVAISAVLLKTGAVPDVPETHVAGTGPGQSTQVAQLITRSQALERELSSARPQVVVWNSGREARAAAIEQRLRMIDAQLNYADPDSAESLWRDRVKLMNALVELHKPQEPGLMYASYQY